jgi:hypothetical protein
MAALVQAARPGVPPAQQRRQVTSRGRARRCRCAMRVRVPVEASTLDTTGVVLLEGQRRAPSKNKYLLSDANATHAVQEQVPALRCQRDSPPFSLSRLIGCQRPHLSTLHHDPPSDGHHARSSVAGLAAPSRRSSGLRRRLWRRRRGPHGQEATHVGERHGRPLVRRGGERVEGDFSAEAEQRAHVLEGE